MARMRCRKLSSVSRGDVPKGEAGAAKERAPLRPGGIGEGRYATPRTLPDKDRDATDASQPSLCVGRGGSDGVSRGWAAMGLERSQRVTIDARMYLFCSKSSGDLGQGKIEQEENKNCGLCNINAAHRPHVCQTTTLNSGYVLLTFQAETSAAILPMTPPQQTSLSKTASSP